MSIFVGAVQVTPDTLHAAWAQVQPLFGNPPLETGAQIVLAAWCTAPEPHRCATWAELSTALKLELGRRENYFFQQAGENLNIETVIYRTEVPTTSIGWTEKKFFEELGNPRNRRRFSDSMTSTAMRDLMMLPYIRAVPLFLSVVTEGLKRRAEQEYLLQNMVKGAMWDAAEVADECKVGIAVRGTGLLAHMGIESGDPTKAQEFKNKTSKLVDLFLCEEMEASQLGAVVHYDPRVGWSALAADSMASIGHVPMFPNPPTEAEWQLKRLTLNHRFEVLGRRHAMPSDDALRSAFMSRAKEYMEEDHEYRKGHYAPYTTLVGPYVRLKVRADKNMVGDHDLFAFTKPSGEDYGVFLPDSDPRVARAQKALQNKPTFQAQHGGIWYWEPGTTFNVGIKRTIMGAHGPTGKEPLVYSRPGKEVTAAYYVIEGDNLASVWSNPTWTRWMADTHSGAFLLPPAPAGAAAGPAAPAGPAVPAAPRPPAPAASADGDGW
jgi:hypothetical protein